MTRTFAPWVQPTASVLAEDRARVLAFCHTVTSHSWDAASVVAGWANRDVLAHLAGGNDQLLQLALRAVTHGETPDSALLEPNTDAENARRIEERRTWSIPRLLIELERDGEEVQDLLARLTDRDDSVSWGTPPRPLGALTLGALLRGVRLERHDLLHLAQLEQHPP
ncbi:MAG: maleylpyruvate isomerase N-terminal domain-containing protein [Tepidiformaceae bacterium]